MATQAGVSQQIFPLEELVAGPLKAIIKAHSELSCSAAQFMAEHGLEPNDDENEPARLRMVELLLPHPAPDPNNPGQVIITPTIISIPAMALYSPPSLKIDEATLDFSVKVVGTEPNKRFKEDSLTPAYKLNCAFAPMVKKGAATQTPFSPSINISIKLKQDKLAEGMSRVATLMHDAMSATPLQRFKPSSEQPVEDQVAD